MILCYKSWIDFVEGFFLCIKYKCLLNERCYLKGCGEQMKSSLNGVER